MRFVQWNCIRLFGFETFIICKYMLYKNGTFNNNLSRARFLKKFLTCIVHANRLLLHIWKQISKNMYKIIVLYQIERKRFLIYKFCIFRSSFVCLNSNINTPKNGRVIAYNAPFLKKIFKANDLKTIKMLGTLLFKQALQFSIQIQKSFICKWRSNICGW